jgi:benzylsuccinate CoA-transferase BbsF subunit
MALRHPGIGEFSCDAPPFRLSKTPYEARTPGHRLGEHNEYVCTKILGLSDAEFLDLMQEGIFD